jgi:hypothetical protein
MKKALKLLMSVYSIKLAYRRAAILSLFSGMAIYVFFRQMDHIIFFKLFTKPVFLGGLPFHIDSGNFALSFMVFQGPDILWLLCGLFFIRSVWIENKLWMQKYVTLFFIIAIVFELCQILPFFPGTFDMFDLLFLCITAFMESAIYNYFFRRIL